MRKTPALPPFSGAKPAGAEIAMIYWRRLAGSECKDEPGNAPPMSEQPKI